MAKQLNEYTKEELVKYVKSLKKQKTFGLVWEETPEQVVKDIEEKLPILEEVKERAIGTDEHSKTNLIIEGDNYHSLSTLNYTHAGQVDIIYIDPPYNTGNKDFIYNDAFINEEDEFRHSKWLSFMSKRLELAKHLLKNTGIIFISIDDNEQAYLKLLCDQIFGEENFIDTIMVEMSNTGGMKVGAAKAGKIAKNGEFILVYGKSTQHKDAKRTPLFDYVSGFDTHFNLYLTDQNKIKKLSEVITKDEQVLREFEHFGVKATNGSISLKYFSKYFDQSEILQKYVLNNLNNIVRLRNEIPNIPKTIQLEQDSWTEYFSEKRHDPYYLTLDSKNEIVQLVPLAYNYRETDDFVPRYGRSVIRGDFWKGFWIDMGNIGKEGGVEFKNGKKPVRLIKQLLKWSVGTNKDALVLDFFAGSGTTGHAVLELNKEDGGHRTFILCTSGVEKEVENKNIAQDITHLRISNVLQPTSDNVRYFKTAFVKKDNTLDKLRRELSPACEGMIRIREAAYDLVIDEPMLKVYKNTRGLTAIVYDRFELADYIQKIENLDTNSAVHLYVFSYDKSIRNEEMPNDLKHTYKSQPIPEGVLEIYRKIFRKDGVQV